MENSRAKTIFPFTFSLTEKSPPARVLLPAGVMSRNNEEKTKKRGNEKMKGFIETTVYAGRERVLIPVRIITGIVEDKDGTFIETGLDGKGKLAGVFVTESYEEVKQKIQKCEV